MKNNRGQVLIVFILLLPVFFMLAGLIIDGGYLFIEKRNMDNNVQDALKYGLKHTDIETSILKNKLKRQLQSNIENVKLVQIEINNKTIEITVNKTRKSIFTVIYSKYEYEISAHYRGYINNEKVIIRKV